MAALDEGTTVLLYDHGGHNFTCELARDLAAQGTPIVYAYTEGVTAPHGRLEDSEDLRVVPMGHGRKFERYKIPARVVGEVRLGLEAAGLARRTKVGHVITCNMPVIIVAILAGYCRLTRRRFTIWFQDSQAGIATKMVKSGLGLRLIALVERWGLRRADRVIAISEALVREAERMGVKKADIALLPNWAPIAQIPVMDKVNDWSVREELSERFVFLYSGTLGLKHSPEKLVELARWIKAEGNDAVVLVVSEGPFAEQVEAEAKRDGLPLIRKGYQPAELLPQVLATADVCLVLLDAQASEFSVPSKVWSYMCAGRPILGCMPLENEAAKVITEDAKAGVVVPPCGGAGLFTDWAKTLREDERLRSSLAAHSRSYAAERFSLPATLRMFRTSASVHMGEQRA